MKTLYQVVGLSDLPGDTLMTFEELQARFGDRVKPVTTEKAERRVIRSELCDKANIEGLCGPMWGGWRDASGQYVFIEDDKDPTSAPKSYSTHKGPIESYVVRYETWEAYDALSR